MLGGLRRHLTYANVMATIAVFMALGGISYAAVRLPKNSVGSKEIKNSSIRGADVRNSSLTGRDVKNSSLTGADVRNSSLTGGDIRDGSLSTRDFGGSLPAGAAGPAGAQGPAGDRGQTGLPGSQGPPGPVYAEFEDREVPVDSPDGTLGEPDPTAITTPAAGRLLVTFTTDAFQAGCTSGSSSLGLYVDGTPVPNTLREFPPAAASRPVSIFGVTANAVPAGAHTLTVGRDCPTGNPTFTAVGQNNNLGAILLSE